MSKANGHWWLLTSGLLFAFYCVNVGVGKIALMLGKKPLFSIGDVGELLVLFAAVICFVVTMLEREAQLEE